MKSCCLKCKIKTDSISSREESIANKLIIDKWKCKTCKAIKITFEWQKFHKKKSVCTNQFISSESKIISKWENRGPAIKPNLKRPTRSSSRKLSAGLPPVKRLRTNNYAEDFTKLCKLFLRSLSSIFRSTPLSLSLSLPLSLSTWNGWRISCNSVSLLKSAEKLNIVLRTKKNTEICIVRYSIEI